MTQRDGSSFESFVKASKGVYSKKELFDLFVATLADIGFDRLNFSIQFDRELERRHWGFGLISTYPLDWQAYYAAMRFADIDPVLRRATGVSPPFWWRDLPRYHRLAPEQIAFLNEGEAAGLYNGLGIPFRGPAMQKAGVALATSTQRLSACVDVDIVVAICNHFYTTYKRICHSQVLVSDMTILSQIECDILLNVSHGRKDKDIARVLGRSPTTINYHFRQILTKLDVATRTQAAAHAIHNGIIELGSVSDAPTWPRD